MTRRRAATAVLLHREVFSMCDNWIYHIELRRSAHAKFTVRGTKFGSVAQTWRNCWGKWDKVEGLTSPLGIRTAVQGRAELLGSEVEWVDAIPLIASIDWVTAAVLAHFDKSEVPRLPTVEALLEQRGLRALVRVTIGVIWGYDMHELQMPFERWIRILGGEPWTIDEGYWYEGQRFTGCWTFDGRHGLEVTYDDGGVGWQGELQGMDLIAGPQVDGVDLARLALSAAPSL